MHSWTKIFLVWTKFIFVAKLLDQKYICSKLFVLLDQKYICSELLVAMKKYGETGPNNWV